MPDLRTVGSAGESMSRPSGFSRAEIDHKLHQLREDVPARARWDGTGRRYALDVRAPGEAHWRHIGSEAEWRRLAPRITKAGGES